jgi:uncharacterized protein
MNDFLNNTDGLEESSEKVKEEQTPSPIDAVIHVLIASSKLEAILKIDPPMYGGALVTFDACEKELAKYNITNTVDTTKLKAICENPIYSQDIKIAKGVEAINGIDGTYTLKFEIQKDLKPKERENGSIDYQDLGIVENVNKGQVLCEISLPTDGTEGVSVNGEKRLPMKGKAVPSLLGKNTELNSEGTAILSTINGQVEYSRGKINVSETFVIPGNVDNRTGSLKVLGNIVIKGMVYPGFVIEAEGNIEIKGTVESATLKAGGNIILRSGITGSKLICGGDLVSRFIENSNVTIKGEGKSEYIINSNILCGKSLKITGSFARFSGGSCVIGQDLIVPTIGYTSGVKTKVEIGTDPSVLERQQEINKELPNLKKQINSLKQLISLLDQLEAADRLDSEKRLALEKARYSYDISMALIEKENQELVEINELIQKKGYGKIICTGIVYPGTKIKIGNEKMVVTEPITHMTFYNSEGNIYQIPIR